MHTSFSDHKSINIIHHIKRSKDRNFMIISVDARTAFEKIQSPFFIKVMKNIGIQEHTSTEYRQYLTNWQHT